MLMQNFIKLSATVHELLCRQSFFCSISQWWKIWKSGHV